MAITAPNFEKLFDAMLIQELQCDRIFPSVCGIIPRQFVDKKS